MRPHRSRPAPTSSSAFARFYFPSDVIVLAVRWYLRFNLSYPDLEELLAERGVEVDHTTVYRWVQRFTRCWPTPPGRAGTRSEGAGRSTRPT
jgi:IS6 family transposase